MFKILLVFSKQFWIPLARSHAPPYGRFAHETITILNVRPGGYMSNETAAAPKKALGFWGCWALTVGVMIGSGVFMLPTVLAPYGMLSFGGWVITAGGSITVALVLGRLAGRTTYSGGPYTFSRDAFGNLPGFLVAWGYWAAVWIGNPAIAIAFVGYLTIFIPALEGNALYQIFAALALMWGLTLLSIRGAREMSIFQLLMTILKLIPLLTIIAWGAMAGTPSNMPEFNPSGGALRPVLSTTVVLTLWAFAGLESGTIPAGDVRNAKTTIPRATVIGTITVAVVYITSTIAVMMLVPTEELVASTSPFADAARGLGTWGPLMVAAGAIVSTAGSLNGGIFLCGQMPMSVAIDGLAPKVFAKLNSHGSPQFSLIFGTTISSILLILNYSRGLVGAFVFLIMMSTLTILVPYLVCALAELKHSIKNARAWAVVALIAAVYSSFAIWGASQDAGGLEVIGWGLAWMAVGLPVYWLGKARTPKA